MTISTPSQLIRAYEAARATMNVRTAIAHVASLTGISREAVAKMLGFDTKYGRDA